MPGVGEDGGGPRGLRDVRRLLEAVARGRGRLLEGASKGLVRGFGTLDVALGRLDDAAGRWKRLALRAARLSESDVTVERVLSGAPPWLRRGISALESRLEDLGAWVDRFFSYLPANREWKRAFSGLALLLAVVAAAHLAGPLPEARPLLPGAFRPIIIGYFENGWSATYPDSYPTLQRYAERIDIVMPFWYSVHPDGNIEDRGHRREVVDFAHRNGIPVVPLVNNAKTGRSAGFLTDPASREEAAAALRDLVFENGFDGLHLDFERLPASWRDHLTSFVAEVRAFLGPSRHLSVAVFPQVGVPTSISGIYDYAALSGLCDFLVIMCYDHHYAGGPSGPVSPYDWTEDNVARAVRDLGVPPEKVVVAVGAYGYDWPAGGLATTVPSRAVADLARQRDAVTRWDPESRNPYFVYYSGRTRHEVWYQDERVMADRIAIARKYALRGLAIWRLGYETPATWTVVMGELGLR